MNANVPPGLSQRRTSARNVGEPGARDVAQPEAAEERVDRPVRLGPGVAHVEVGAQAVGEQPLARPVERRLGRVVQRQLALRGEQRRPPAGAGGQLDDLAARAAARRARGVAVSSSAFQAASWIGAARVAAAAQVPVVVLGGAGLVVGDASRASGSDGVGSGAGGAAVGRGRRRRRPARRPRSLGQRLAQPEPQEPVVAGLADAVGAELGPALEVVGAAASCAAGRTTGSRTSRRNGIGAPTAARPASSRRAATSSTNPSGSKISASSPTPSMTRGPGPAEVGRAVEREDLPARTAASSRQPRRAAASAPTRRRVSARWKPQGIRMSISGSTSRTASQVVSTRPLALAAEEVPAAGPPDLLGHPVADGERRVEPLEADDPRRRGCPASRRSSDPRLDRRRAARAGSRRGRPPRPRPRSSPRPSRSC